MSTYAVGDIHGCFAEWMTLKDRIEEKDPDARFILLGDIVDRGPEVYAMLCWAMEHVTETGKYQMILGNHEFGKIDWLKEYFRRTDEAALAEEKFSLKSMRPDGYDFRRMCLAERLTNGQLWNILHWMKSLPVYKEILIPMGERTQRFILVHAALPSSCVNKDGSFRRRALFGIFPYKIREVKEAVVWSRTEENPSRDAIVIHGHTPTISDYFEDNPDRDALIGRIRFHDSFTVNIDCGCVFKGLVSPERANLAALRLEDLEEYYVYDYGPEERAKGTESRKNKEKMLKGRQS